MWPDKHRSIDNRFLITDYERFPSVFTLAKRARPTIRTAYFGNWGPIGERILVNDPIDVRLSLQDPKNDAPQTEACVAALGKDDGIDLAFFMWEMSTRLVMHSDFTAQCLDIARRSKQLMCWSVA